MLKLTDKKAVKVLITGLVLPGLFSCAKKEYDLDNLNKEVTIAQSGLALPIGSTKQITVKDLLKDVETDVLTQFNGGYAIKFEDKMKYPERIVATYWKNEPNEEWGSEDKKVRVKGRRWVKIK